MVSSASESITIAQKQALEHAIKSARFNSKSPSLRVRSSSLLPLLAQSDEMTMLKKCIDRGLPSEYHIGRAAIFLIGF